MPELTTPQPPPEFVTAQELAGILRVSRSQIYKVANAEKWPCHRVGTVMRFPLQRILRITETTTK